MKKNKTEDRISQIIELIEKVNLSTNSVCWWEKEMDSTLDKMDKLEDSSDPKDKIELEKLTQKLANLIPRAKLEMEIIDKLEADLENLIKELNEKEKNKKSPRKKDI
jgi:hypothetical protein